MNAEHQKAGFGIMVRIILPFPVKAENAQPHLRNHLAGTGDFLHGAVTVGRHFLLKKRNLEPWCAYYLAGIRLD